MNTTIDSSNMPELVRIVEQAEATKKPLELKRDNKIVAVLSPAISPNKEKWKQIRATFGSWKDRDAHELIAKMYRWREEGTQPAIRPS